jgi:hypothetical protein
MSRGRKHRLRLLLARENFKPEIDQTRTYAGPASGRPTAPPLSHHRACGSAHGSSAVCAGSDMSIVSTSSFWVRDISDGRDTALSPYALTGSFTSDVRVDHPETEGAEMKSYRLRRIDS